MKWIAIAVLALLVGAVIVTAESRDSDRRDHDQHDQPRDRAHDRHSDRAPDRAHDRHSDRPDRTHDRESDRRGQTDRVHDRAKDHDRPIQPVREPIGSSGSVTGAETLSWNWTVADGFHSLSLDMTLSGGAYQWTLTAPNGTETQDQGVLPEGNVLHLRGADFDEGKWTLTLTLAGAASYDVAGFIAHLPQS